MKKQTKIKGYVARDEDGSIHLFETDPERVAECAWAEFPGHTLGIRLPDNSFPEVTWKAEPVEVSVSVSLPEPPSQEEPLLSTSQRLAIAYILFFIGFCIVYWIIHTPHEDLMKQLTVGGWIVGVVLFFSSFFYILGNPFDKGDQQESSQSDHKYIQKTDGGGDDVKNHQHCCDDRGK